MNSSDKVVCVNSITRKYIVGCSIVTAVNQISVAINKGNFVSLHGKSGCGKTTLLMMLGGLLKPDSGTVNLLDRDIFKENADKRAYIRAQNIGFVFQQFHLIPYLTVFDNIWAPAIALGKKKDKSKVLKLSEKFGIANRLNHYPSQLSTGECQRTALARALYNNPKLILADEPTGNLDEQNANDVLCALKEFTQEGGAVLLVSHDSRAKEFSDTALHMSNGMLI